MLAGIEGSRLAANDFEPWADPKQDASHQRQTERKPVKGDQSALGRSITGRHALVHALGLRVQHVKSLPLQTPNEVSRRSEVGISEKVNPFEFG